MFVPETKVPGIVVWVMFAIVTLVRVILMLAMS